MTRRKSYLPFLVLSFIACQPAENKLQYRTIRSTEGWGYEIALNGKLIIRQEHMPAIGTLRGFESEKQAISAATLVIKRLQKKETPTLSVKDLEMIKELR